MWLCFSAASFPGDIIRGGQVSILGLFGATYTSGICTGIYTSGICIGSEYPTSSTYGIVCGGGGGTLMTCRGGLFGSCDGGIPSITSSTCGVFGVGCISRPKERYEPIEPFNPTGPTCTGSNMSYCRMPLDQILFTSTPAF